MSFISILKKIGTTILGVEHVAAPVIGALYPPAAPFLTNLDNLIQSVFGSIISTEQNNPKDGQGKIKSDSVNADINAYIATMNAGLALMGKTTVDDPALRQATIDAAVASLNAGAAWKASFKVVDLPKA